MRFHILNFTFKYKALGVKLMYMYTQFKEGKIEHAIQHSVEVYNFSNLLLPQVKMILIHMHFCS